MMEVRMVADCLVIMIDSKESVEAFKELVHRAANLWPDASPEIKEFADVITNGDWIDTANRIIDPRKGPSKGLQDYGNTSSFTGDKK